MYLVLRPPWAGGPAAVTVDAGVVATTGSGDAGVKPKKKKVRRPAGSPGAVAGGSDEWIDEGPELVQVVGADLAIKSRGAAQ
ncbi:MAG: hypothetical protein NT062_24870, partial [Proteobacteria bacterium]|nr:hypothetical protein [Pseudomonadota bacterium]